MHNTVAPGNSLPSEGKCSTFRSLCKNCIAPRIGKIVGTNTYTFELFITWIDCQIQRNGTVTPKLGRMIKNDIPAVSPNREYVTSPRIRDRKSTRLNSSHQIISYA